MNPSDLIIPLLLAGAAGLRHRGAGSTSTPP